jgi:NADH:ubiquinone oxidoreductase subunit E
MKKLALVFVLSAAAALAAEWTGYVSESKCGAKHNDGSAASIGCVKGCIKGGAKPVLVVDGKVVAISNPDKVPEALSGLKVTVSGELKDEAVEIETIEAAK